MEVRAIAERKPSPARKAMELRHKDFEAVLVAMLSAGDPSSVRGRKVYSLGRIGGFEQLAGPENCRPNPHA